MFPSIFLHYCLCLEVHMQTLNPTSSSSTPLISPAIPDNVYFSRCSRKENNAWLWQALSWEMEKWSVLNSIQPYLGLDPQTLPFLPLPHVPPLPPLLPLLTPNTTTSTLLRVKEVYQGHQQLTTARESSPQDLNQKMRFVSVVHCL